MPPLEELTAIGGHLPLSTGRSCPANLHHRLGWAVPGAQAAAGGAERRHRLHRHHHRLPDSFLVCCAPQWQVQLLLCNQALTHLNLETETRPVFIRPRDSPWNRRLAGYQHLLWKTASSLARPQDAVMGSHERHRGRKSASPMTSMLATRPSRCRGSGLITNALLGSARQRVPASSGDPPPEPLGGQYAFPAPISPTSAWKASNVP